MPAMLARQQAAEQIGGWQAVSVPVEACVPQPVLHGLDGQQPEQPLTVVPFSVALFSL